MNYFLSLIDLILGISLSLMSLISLFKGHKSNWKILINSFVFISYTSILNYYLLQNTIHPLDFSNVTGPKRYIYDSSIYLTISLFSLFIFESIRFYFFKRIPDFITIPRISSNKLFITSFFLILYVLIFGIERDLNFAEGLYKVRISRTYEYGKFLILLLFYSLGNSNKKKVIVIIITLLYTLQDFVYGGRISGIQGLLILFMYNFQSVRRYKLIISGIIMFFTASIVGAIRSNPLEILNKFSEEKGLLTFEILNQVFSFSPAVWSFYTSISQIYTAMEVDTYTRILSFIQSILKIFSGDSILNNIVGEDNISNTSYFSKDYLFNLGGGIAPTWYYFWLGFLGVLILTWVQWRLLFIYSLKNKHIAKLIFLTMIISFPRWFLYGPHVFFRGSFIVFPIIFVALSILCSVKNKNIVHK